MMKERVDGRKGRRTKSPQTRAEDWKSERVKKTKKNHKVQISETERLYKSEREGIRRWDVNKTVWQGRRRERRTDGREGRWKAGNARTLPDHL